MTHSKAHKDMGLFITFEGGEGSGKSTQIKLLKEYICSLIPDIEIVLTREPGGTEVAELIRDILVNGASDKLSPRAEALLMIASRAEHIDLVILPALGRGAIVLCDRFKDSSVVYQGLANNISKEEIDKIHEFALKRCEPDLTILLDIPAETGIKRALDRNESDQRFEQKGDAFHQRIREGYLKLAAIYPDRIKVINASQTVHSISDEIQQLIKPMLIDRRHK
jgi:dTMP kinase